MNPDQAKDLLSAVAAYDTRRNWADPGVISAWAYQLDDLDFPDALDAVHAHYRSDVRVIMPSDVRARVAAARADRANRVPVTALTAAEDPAEVRAEWLRDGAARIGRVPSGSSGTGAPRPPSLGGGSARALAIAVACPWCRANPGAQCTTAGRPLRTPHPSRFEAAGVDDPAAQRVAKARAVLDEQDRQDEPEQRKAQ